MRIGIDVDGVTLDFHRALRERYEEWFGREVPEFRRWNDPLDLLHFDTWGDMWAWADRADVWHDMHRVPGAPGAIDALLDAGPQVAFVTSRSEVAASAARRWHRASPWIGRSSLFTDLGANKFLVKCSVYVDDAPSVIKALRREGKQVIRFHREWNKHMRATPSAKSWDEVLGHIEALEAS